MLVKKEAVMSKKRVRVGTELEGEGSATEILTKSVPKPVTMFEKIIEAHRLMYNIESTLSRMRSDIVGEAESNEGAIDNPNTLNSSVSCLIERLEVANERLFKLSKDIGMFPVAQNGIQAERDMNYAKVLKTNGNGHRVNV